MAPASPPEPATVSPSPRPKRIASPSWLDLRLVLGVVLVLASMLIGAKVVSGASHTDPAVAVTRDLAAGTVLTRDDLRVSQVHLPDAGARRYLSTVATALGKRLTRPVSRDELLPAAAVGTVRPQTTLTVPLAAAAAPQLRAGQRIEMWLSSASCASVVLLDDVTVQSVHADGSGSLGGGDGGQDVVIDVDPDRAQRVVQALAIDGATVRAGVLVGASSPTPTARASTGAVGGSGGGAPDDLASCASPTPTR